MARLTRLSTIYTSSQRWARQNNACLAGRRRLGRLSIYAYFNRTGNMSDMGWVASKLEPKDPSNFHTYQEQLRRLGNWVRGAYKSPFTYRKAIKMVMCAYDVRWPTEIL